MSSLRVGSLRLCWLEAFVAVTDEENISEAANKLGVDQSTVSRYVQALERWAGKKLIEPGKIEDPENPRVSIGITDDGQALRELAVLVLDSLNEFRDEKHSERGLLSEIGFMISNMENDRSDGKLVVLTEHVRPNVDMFRDAFDNFNEDTPLHLLQAYRGALRQFFNRYERERNEARARQRAEARIRRKRGKPVPTLSLGEGEVQPEPAGGAG